MKKQYIEPTATVFETTVQSIIATSGSGYDAPDFNYGEEDDSFGTGSGTMSPGSAV